jgi:hypothetical protein
MYEKADKEGNKAVTDSLDVVEDNLTKTKRKYVSALSAAILIPTEVPRPFNRNLDIVRRGTGCRTTLPMCWTKNKKQYGWCQRKKNARCL